MNRCQGTTKRGTQCRLYAVQGSDFCKIHTTQDFGKPVSWIGMSPAEAKRFARILLDLANPITRRKPR